MTSNITTYLFITAIVIVIAVLAYNQLGDGLIEITEYTSKVLSEGVRQ